MLGHRSKFVASTAVLAAATLAGRATATGGNVFVVDTTADTVDANPGDGTCADANGNCSLRAAIMEANALGTETCIQLGASQLYTLALAGAGEDAAATGDLDVSGQVEILGNGSTVDAAGLDRAFDVLAGASLELDSLVVVNGAVSADSGGGLRTAGRLQLDLCSVQRCSATGAGASGGGLFNAGGLLKVMRSTVAGNAAERAGGGIEANVGVTHVEQSNMSGNSTGPGPGNGGALHLTGAGVVELRGVAFRSNVAAREGGGVWNSSTGSMSVTNCRFEDNEANGLESHDGGGGLFNDGGTLAVERSVVIGNRASQGSGSGGGLFNNAGRLQVSNCRIVGNSSNRAGGGIEALVGSTHVAQSSFDGNSTGASPGNGGGLHLTGAGSVDFDRCQFTDNVASAEGGAFWNSSTGSMTANRCDLMNNRASGDAADQGGGGAFNDGGRMQVLKCRVSGNIADGAAGSGGGILNVGGVLDVVDSLIADNSSQRAGGGIEANLGTTRLSRVSLLGNSTGPAPGNGGGLHLTGAGLVSVRGGTVVRNTASNEGGGLWNSSTGVMIVEGANVNNNTAPIGPDLFNDGGTFLVDGVPVL